MRNLAFAVLPYFRARRAIVGFGIHRVVVLIGIIRIGNFAREFLGYGIITPRILRLDRGGAHNHFRAQGFQQIHFLLGLLVRGGKHAFVAAHRRHQRQPHAGIPGSALDDRATGFQQTALFRIVDHGEANTVFHGAAGVREFRLHVHLRLEVLVNAVQPHQGRVPDSFQNVVALHPLSRSLSVVSSSPRRCIQFSILAKCGDTW